MNVARLEHYRQLASRRAHVIAQEIVDEIAANPDTATRTGRLRNSYDVASDGDSAVIRTDTYYWLYVEYGTEDTEAQPHVRPAIETIRALHR